MAWNWWPPPRSWVAPRQLGSKRATADSRTSTCTAAALSARFRTRSRTSRETAPDFQVLADLDKRSFDPLWRSTATGLRESYRATLRRTVLVTPGGHPHGFAIVGCSGVTAYLQRIAVSPSRRGRGLGSRLIFAAIRWAVHHGAASMLLNTPPANRAAAALYGSTGFRRLPDRLAVLRFG